MKNRLATCYSPVALLAFALVFSSSTVRAQHPWPTLEFKVINANPHAHPVNPENDWLSVDWLEFEDRFDTINDYMRQEIEAAFHEAAKWYQSRGFPPPLLERMEPDSGPYRIYVCNRETEQMIFEWATNPNYRVGQLNWETCVGSEAHYTPACPQNLNRRTKIIIVNADRVLNEGGAMTEQAYQTMAHELFHAIWYNTEAGRADEACQLNHWIVEGLADAIGWDMMEGAYWRARFTPSTHAGTIGKRWGSRPYFEPLIYSHDIRPLPHEPSVTLNLGYRTSSFWRHVVDSDSRGWELMTSPRGSGMLDEPFLFDEGEPVWKSELAWADKVLRQKLNRGLDALFASFTNHFALSIPPSERFRTMTREAGLPDNEIPMSVQSEWTGLLFVSAIQPELAPCEVADLYTNPVQKLIIRIKGLAARCVRVRTTGRPGGTQVTFQVAHKDLGLIRDIWIGQPGSSLQVRANAAGKATVPLERYVAPWRDYPQDGEGWTLYVITNVARDPVQTRDREFELVVSRPATDHTALGELPTRLHVPAPVKPSFRKHASTHDQLIKATQQMVEKQMKVDKGSMTTNVAHAVRFNRQPKRGGCATPFVYSSCGPRMTIRLSVEPGIFGQPGMANAQGGFMAQLVGGGLANARASHLDPDPEVSDSRERIEALDGHEVRIYTPMFDYGFSGSFDSAEIIVTMGDGRKLRTFGPKEGPGRRHPLTGRVTIEEYSLFVLRGSFEAPLAELVKDARGREVYTPRGTVTGTFTSVAPWEADERIATFQLDSEEERREDFFNNLGLPIGIFEGRERGEDSADSGSDATTGNASNSGGGNVDSNPCDCSCAVRDTADDLCALWCEDEFAACDGP